MSQIKEILEEWQSITLDKYCTFTQGIQIPHSEQFDEFKEGFIRYLYIRDYFSDSSACYVKNAYPNKIMNKEDIMMVNTGNTSGTVYSGKYGVLSNNAFKIGFDKKYIDRDFIFQFLKSDFLMSHLKKLYNHGGQPHVGHKNVAQVPLDLPPLPEQQKIADILNTVDAKIEVIDQQITETQELKKGLMQRLLTKGIGHTEFKESPLGEIPMSWEVVKFSKLISKEVITHIQDGNHGGSHPVSDDFVNEGIPFIMANCITKSNKLNLSKAKRISEKQYNSLRIGFAKPNDVLLTHKGTVGLTAMVNTEHGNLMLTPQVTYYRITQENVLLRKYLFYYFQSSLFQNLIDKFSKQSTRAYIGITNQKKLQITLPSDIIEQKSITNILTSVDEKLDVLLEKKTTYQELKKALMQQLLTGKVRVKV